MLSGAGIAGSVAQQLPANIHTAPSAKALLPALAILHAAAGQSRQTRQSERILRHPVIFILGERRNTQETLGFCRYILVASQTSYAGLCEQGIRNG
jgi:hypothetical protein